MNDIKSVFIEGLKLGLIQKSLTFPTDIMFYPYLFTAYNLPEAAYVNGMRYYDNTMIPSEKLSLMLDDYMEYFVDGLEKPKWLEAYV